MDNRLCGDLRGVGDFWMMPFQMPAIWSAFAPIWVRCHCCEEFLCLLHQQHVAECSCPPIERWSFSPYNH